MEPNSFAFEMCGFASLGYEDLLRYFETWDFYVLVYLLCKICQIELPF